MKNLTWNDVNEGDAIEVLSMEEVGDVAGAGWFKKFLGGVAVALSFSTVLFSW